MKYYVMWYLLEQGICYIGNIWKQQRQSKHDCLTNKNLLLFENCQITFIAEEKGSIPNFEYRK